MNTEIILLSNLQTICRFYQLSQYCKGTPNHVLHSVLMPLSRVFFNREEFLSLSLCFMTLTFLKCTRQLFYKACPELGLSDVSSWMNSGYAPLVEYRRGEAISFLVHHIQTSSALTCPITGNVNFDHVKCSLPGLSTAKFHFTLCS